jgi:hypothetical protein
MSKGFIVLAQNTEKVDYVQQAYALALSIKISQPDINNISLVTNDVVPENYKKAFDKIIPIPFNDDAVDSNWKIENRWKIIHATPYDETMVLEADMLVLEDLSNWWEYCSNFDFRLCNKIKNYKQQYVDESPYRKTFIENDLSNPYFALHYFKKTDLAFAFYKCLELISFNREFFYGKFTPNEYQKWLSMDLASAIAVKMLAAEDLVYDVNSPLEFIHMKPAIQGWDPIPASWQDTVPFFHTRSGSLVVGNIKQSKIFHYVEKDFITKKILSNMEATAYGTE